MSEGDGQWGQLVFLDMAQNIIVYDITSDHAIEVQDGEPNADIKVQRSYFLTRAQPCASEADKEAPDTDPWLPVWTSEDSPNGSPLALGSSQINTWHVANYLNEILGVTSSLFSSPNKILPDHVLEDGTYFLTEGLLESSPAACEVEGSQEKEVSCEGPTGPPNFQSSVSLDHCYLSLSENVKVLSNCGSSSEATDRVYVGTGGGERPPTQGGQGSSPLLSFLSSSRPTLRDYRPQVMRTETTHMDPYPVVFWPAYSQQEDQEADKPGPREAQR